MSSVAELSDFLAPCLRVFLEAFLKPLDETLFNTFETCRSATNQNNCSLPKVSGVLKCLIQRFQKRSQKNSQTWCEKIRECLQCRHSRKQCIVVRMMADDTTPWEK